MPVDTEPHCGCALPPGSWGNHGWHWLLADAGYLMEREQRSFCAEREDWTAEERRKGWELWLQSEERQGRIKDGFHVHFRTYLGQPVATEPCPTYRAVVARNVEKETRRKKGGRRRLLGEEEDQHLPYQDR